MDIHDLCDHDKLVVKVLQDSMIAGKAVTLEYKGETRDVEIHAIGVSKAMNPVVRGFDIEKKSWRLFSVANIDDAHTFKHIPSYAPRTLEGYVKGDKGMVDILVEA